MRLLLLICAALKVVSGASGVTGGAMMNMAMITELDVICDKSGMTVTIDFSQPFNGIIFSKGHYSNPACRYVGENSGQSSYTIRIPSSECGSLMDQVRGETTRTQLSNTIIVQNDEAIQEIWDVARLLTCDWVDNYVKTVNFNPFSVGMLRAEEVRFKGDQPIECWMDLQLGRWPEVSDINSIVKIGDTLSLIVYARDNERMYDVSVKDCYAFAGPDYDDPNTPRLQLTDKQGCVIKDKLIGPFNTAREDDSQGSTLVTYAYVHAFKFPDVMDVFMTCNMEICKGDCDNKCYAPTTVAPSTESPRRSGSTLFGEPIYTTKPTPNCGSGSTSPECYPTSTTTIAPTKPKCYKGSKDPSCFSEPPKQGKQLFPSSTNCVPGSSDPSCLSNINIPETTSQKPPPKITTRKPKCYPGSTDPSCGALFPTELQCFSNSKDPRCKKEKPTTTARPKCYPSSKDPRCPKPQPTTTPGPRCYPGSLDERCPQIKTTPKPPVCYPGSVDPRCPKPTTEAFRCYKGSTHPACTTTPQPTTTTPPPPVTPKDECFPGSLNPNCETVTKDGRYGSILFPATITTTPSTTTVQTTPYTTPLTVPYTVPTKKPSGGIIFSEPASTPRTIPPRPRLKPKTTTTKSPNRGKQLSEPKSKPEPTGKEWEGESRFHAFHSFHYQRGDGRRSRVFGQRIVPKTSRSRRMIRSVDQDQPRPLEGKKPLKLSRSISVVTPEAINIFLEKEEELNSKSLTGYVCLTYMMLSYWVGLFLLIILLLLFYVFLYKRQEKLVKKLQNLSNK